MYSVVLVDGGVFVSVNNRNFLFSLLLIDIDDTLWAVMMMTMLSLRFKLNFIQYITPRKAEFRLNAADISGIATLHDHEMRG